MKRPLKRDTLAKKSFQPGTGGCLIETVYQQTSVGMLAIHISGHISKGLPKGGALPLLTVVGILAAPLVAFN